MLLARPHHPRSHLGKGVSPKRKDPDKKYGDESEYPSAHGVHGVSPLEKTIKMVKNYSRQFGRRNTGAAVSLLITCAAVTQAVLELGERRCTAVGSREESERGGGGSGEQRENF